MSIYDTIEWIFLVQKTPSRPCCGSCAQPKSRGAKNKNEQDAGFRFQGLGFRHAEDGKQQIYDFGFADFVIPGVSFKGDMGDM